jgi:hypothetical protein
MLGKLQRVCERWRTQGGTNQRGLVLVVGSTDRVALGRVALVQYESNVGLARARAEQAKIRLRQCAIPDNQILTLVSGPRNTPLRSGTDALAMGFAEDRRVDIWALWSIPAAVADKGAR